MQYIFEQPKYLTYIEYMLIAYYVIGIRNLSSFKIVTIVFILDTKKKLGPPLTFMDLVFTLGGFKLTIAYSPVATGFINV